MQEDGFLHLETLGEGIAGILPSRLEIMVAVVAAFQLTDAGNRAVVGYRVTERRLKGLQYALLVWLTNHGQIEAGAATHWGNVHHILKVIAQVPGEQMLQRVQGRRFNRTAVGLEEAQIVLADLVAAWGGLHTCQPHVGGLNLGVIEIEGFHIRHAIYCRRAARGQCDAARPPYGLPILRDVPTLLERQRTFPAWVPLLLATLLIVADQALKAWALANLREGAPPLPILPGVLDWVLTFNTGAAWSLFAGSALPLAIARLLVGLGILAYLVARPQNRFLTVVLSMIAAGAIGNTIDGLRFGRVTDMLHAPPLSAITRALGAGDFPIFNLADSCVVLGTLLLLIGSFVGERKKS